MHFCEKIQIIEMRGSMPVGSMIRITLVGATVESVTVGRTDAVGSVFDILQQPTSRIIFNGTVLCPALSFGFYGIGDGDSLVVVPSREEALQRHQSKQDLLRTNSELARTREVQVKRYFDEHCAGRVHDPEVMLERFQNALNPTTSLEQARVTDMYRARIETNIRAFRKLCTKFHALESMETERVVKVHRTVVPERAKVPSTDYLPLFEELDVAQEPGPAITSDL